MNKENIRKSIKWAESFPEEQHCMVNYFFHLRNDCTLRQSFKASDVPEDAKMCFGGLTIKKAGLDVKQGSTFLQELTLYWDLPVQLVDSITRSVSMSQAIKKMEYILRTFA
jgi:hypothetical protein